MNKYDKIFLVFDALLFVLQLALCILYCIKGDAICSGMYGFASGLAFMGTIFMYEQCK